MINFDRLAKSYGDHPAVRGLTLEVRGGEVYALLGPNGAGKTTALRCLATLLAPTTGTAGVDGVDVRTDPLGVRRRLGFISAAMGLYERLTARELIAYFGRLHGMEGAALGRRVDELVERFGIGEFADRYCGRLSTGQRQRIGLARAVVQDPPALVLDEPTFGLDVISGESIYAFMREERARGKAILFSTHQMAEVDLLADRAGVLARGRLVAEGTPEAILQQTGEPNLARAFLRLVNEA